MSPRYMEKTYMQSTFGTSRIFNNQDGWYIVMRESDKEYLTGSKHKVIGKQQLMGPFQSKHLTEDWLEGFLSMHSESRNPDTFITDILETHH